MTTLTTAEQICCGFVDFTLRLTSNTVEMTITGPLEARPPIADLTTTATTEPTP